MYQIELQSEVQAWVSIKIIIHILFWDSGADPIFHCGLRIGLSLFLIILVLE